MEHFSKELIAASTIPIVLSILKQGDDYGYNIIKKVQEQTDNKLRWKEGTLYPVLKKMESKRLISSYMLKVEGRNRKYYTISTSGTTALDELKAEWQLMNKTMLGLWNIKENLI